jgi:dTDP-4-amino-4,6-dideoxygalactose transaminase
LSAKDATTAFREFPGASYSAQREEIDDAVRRVCAVGIYVLGNETASFEREFADYIGTRHAIGVASGTDAIELALRACGIGRGAQVVTVSHTAVATVAAIERAGAKPILIDVEREELTMDPEQLRQTLRASPPGRVRAVIPVHLYGRPARMAEIVTIAKDYGLRVIEDAAQAHGAAIGGQRVGTFGDLAAFSFYPTKNLGAFGDGGAVVTSDPQLDERLRELRQYGWRQRSISTLPGINSRLDEMQAAILRVKLRRLEADNALREKWAKRYDHALRDLPLSLPCRRSGVRHVYHLYVIRSARRDDLLRHLRQEGIPAQIHYPAPVHLQPAYFKRLQLGAGGLRETEEACREIITLPLHPHLDGSFIEQVIEALRRWVRCLHTV